MSTSETQPSPRPLEPPPTTGDPRLDAVARLLAIVDRLRDPEGGCPWDLEQSVDSLAPSLVEEAHETVEAIERGDADGTAEESGDLLMVIALMARISEQEGRFGFADVANTVGDKLIRRHPHVFGDVQVDDAEHALSNWEEIKKGERTEKQAEDKSVLSGVPRALPALQRVQRVGAKAISAGFKWNDAAGALAKLREEVGELEHVLADETPDAARVEAELGDVLMAGALLGQYLNIDAERVTRAAVERFETRFRSVEAALGERLGQASLDEMMAAWEAAKGGS